MRIIPIASESLGVRSMCILLKTHKTGIFIDPSAALGPSRYGLPPSNEELKMLEYSFDRIINASQHANYIFVTHYHYDHYPHPEKRRREFEVIFKGKNVIAKDYKNMHASGKERGKIFAKNIERISHLIFGDGKGFDLPDMFVDVSDAVWHGEKMSKVGKVFMVYIECKNKSFLFGSDAQNLADNKAMEWFIEKDPKIAVIDGFPTIFIGWRFSKKSFERSKKNIINVMKKTSIKTLIIEHHVLRDIEYKKKILDIFELANEMGIKIKTYADMLGIENIFLEAWRKKIYRGEIRIDIDSINKKIKEKIVNLL